MNRQITTEEAILNKSKKYILKNGVSSFNMRNIAQECGISIGIGIQLFSIKDKTCDSDGRKCMERNI